MTKEEILGIATGQAAALENANSLLQRFNQPAQTPVDRFSLDIPDDQYIEGRHVKQILQQFANQPVPTDPVARQLASQGLLSAIRMERADEFKRWGPEINAELQKLPSEYWTVDNLNTVVNIIKSKHVDELVAEKAKLLANESHPTIRSGTGGSVSVSQLQQQSLDAEGLPKDWVRQLKLRGIDETTVREFCEKTGVSVAQYYADATKYGKGAYIGG